MLPGDEKTLKTYGNGEHLDIYQQKIVANGYQDQYSRNCLQRNNGDGQSFSDVGLIAGISATDWSWSPLFADLDNDGNKDLFISSGIVHRPLDLDFINFFANLRNPAQYGDEAALQKAMLDKMPDGASHPFVFQNEDGGRFSDESEAWGTAGLTGYFNGAAYADLDRDGRLDLVINCINGPAVILKNNAPRLHWLSLAFSGSDLNRFGIGAKAYVYAGGKRQYQQLMLTRGFESSGEPVLHFGLGDTTVVDSVLVVWPDRHSQLLRHVPTDTLLLLHQTEATTILPPDRTSGAPPSAARSPQSRPESIPWRHRENNYSDFKQQYLIPHMESTRGPKMAIADVNGDGLDDFFVCGAQGQSGALFLQNRSGGFSPADTTAFAANRDSEGVDAVFFDANGDGKPDLYVVSGGSERPDGDTALLDHLYINDGQGHFHETTETLPNLRVNKSCVTAADVNGDGAVDLFVGGGAVARRFGAKETPSYLLLNDGHGRFKSTVLFSDSGMPTAAVFADLDSDGVKDLVVAGEWMPVRVFINKNGSLHETKRAGPKGLWQSLAVTDINGDGHPDILAGNWGLNTKLAAGRDGPLNLYIKDIDGNGTLEQLMTYFIGGEEYPFLGKDQLELALPGLKRSHLRYDEVAGRNLRYLFGHQLDDAQTLHVDTLASLCLFNEGHSGFAPKALPPELQLSPLFSFTEITGPDGRRRWLAVGNFYGVQPYEGRYDALNPTIFTYDREFHCLGSLTQQPGEWRDAKVLRSLGRHILLLARNNDSILVAH
jgi:hypothetical protein